MSIKNLLAELQVIKSDTLTEIKYLQNYGRLFEIFKVFTFVSTIYLLNAWDHSFYDIHQRKM